MQIQVEENPNSPGSEQFVFKELGGPRPVKALVVEIGGREKIYSVTGVEPGGRWTTAIGIKIADSSEGHAFLIRGGEWGIRLKPEKPDSPWDLGDKDQWGEPFKIYGSQEDIIYGEE